MDGGGRILYVPMENRAREFDARLLLTLEAAAANFQVVLGPKWLLKENIDRLPRGIYATKTLNRIDAWELRMARKFGHTTIAWDEEGPGQVVPEIYLKGINDDAMKHAGAIFAWGENQAETLTARYPEAKNKIQAVGNPRWDLLRPEFRAFFEPEAAKIRAKHGPFILINTNFSTYNAFGTFADIAGIADRAGAFKEGDESDQRILSDIHEFERKTFADYTEALPALSAAFPERTIVIRPHPTEKHEPWRELAARFPNVRCIYEGFAIPWLLAADAVVQNSCTTGVEALTLGRPVISYASNDSALQEWHLANHVCPRARDRDSLIGLLKNYLADPGSFAEAHVAGKQILARHISQLDGESSSAAIVRSLVRFAADEEAQGPRFDRTLALAQSLRPYKISRYQQTKLPEITANDIVERVDRIARLRGSLPKIKIAPVHVSCFTFCRKSAPH